MLQRAVNKLPCGFTYLLGELDEFNPLEVIANPLGRYQATGSLRDTCIQLSPDDLRCLQVFFKSTLEDGGV